MVIRHSKTFFRYLFIVTGIFFLVSFLFPISVGILNQGTKAGIVICVVLILIGVFFTSFCKMLSYLRCTLWGKIIIFFFIFILAITLICTFILTGGMLYCSMKVPPTNATVVVLGCKVNGTSPSLMLYDRLKTAEEYLSANPNAKAILSGGQGPNEGISEAQAMYNYLTHNGIDPSRLYLEDKSSNTEENIAFSKLVIEENNLNTEIAIVTDGFHQLRASILAQKQGLNAYGIAVNTRFYFFTPYYVRELMALMEEIVIKEIFI